MLMIFGVSLIIVILLFIGLEIFRRYYTKHINKLFKGEKTKKVPNFFLLSRMVFITAIILLFIVPIGWFSYTMVIKPTDDMTFGLHFEEDLHFELEHNRVYEVPGVSYQFKIQMDILELADAITGGMGEEYDYFVSDGSVYIDMHSHYIKLSKLYDSKYLKDMYILEYDFTALHNETEGLYFYIPFPFIAINQNEQIEYVSNDTYTVEVNEDWDFFKEYYQGLEDVLVEEDSITLIATELKEENGDYYIVQYTIELSYMDGEIYFEIIDITEDAS